MFFILSASSSLVGILIGIGDVTDIFAIPALSRLPRAFQARRHIVTQGLVWIGFVAHGFEKHVVENKTQG